MTNFYLTNLSRSNLLKEIDSLRKDIIHSKENPERLIGQFYTLVNIYNSAHIIPDQIDESESQKRVKELYDETQTILKKYMKNVANDNLAEVDDKEVTKASIRAITLLEVLDECFIKS